MLGEALSLIKVLGMVFISLGAALVMIYANYESNIYTIDVSVSSSLGI